MEKNHAPSTATSRTLLDRVKADDAAAWDRLVGLYAPLVYRWCRRWDLPEQEIADVFQDVFQAVSTHIGELPQGEAGRIRFAAGSGRSRITKYVTISAGWDASQGEPVEPTLRSGCRAFPAAPLPDDDDSSGENADRGLCRRALDLIRDEFEERTWRSVLADRRRRPRPQRGRR